MGNFSDRGTQADKAGHMAGAQKFMGAVRMVGGGGGPAATVGARGRKTPWWM
jgi:hypothetical protein